MPLILAIEPDRRQAAQLTGVIRRVGAELVLAKTTEHALDAIGSQVPDLVLVPALLSPQDDAALAGALRVIAAAAHVRILTTPVFGSTTKRKSSGGVLAKWRRGGAEEIATDGCDPAVFGEQISDYLKEAAAERAEREAAFHPSAEYDVPADKEAAFHPSAEYDVLADKEAAFHPSAEYNVPAGDVTEPTEQLQAAASSFKAPLYAGLAPEFEAVAIDPALSEPIEVDAAVQAPVPTDVLVVEPVFVKRSSILGLFYEKKTPALEAAADVAASSEDVIDLSDQLLDVPVDAALKTFFEDEPGDAHAVASAPEVVGIEVFDLLPAVDPIISTADEPAVEFVGSPTAVDAAALDTAPEMPKVDLWTPPWSGTGRSWPRLEGVQAEAAPDVLDSEEAVLARPETVPVVRPLEPVPIAVAAKLKAPRIDRAPKEAAVVARPQPVLPVRPPSPPPIVVATKPKAPPADLAPKEAAVVVRPQPVPAVRPPAPAPVVVAAKPKPGVVSGFGRTPSEADLAPKEAAIVARPQPMSAVRPPAPAPAVVAARPKAVVVSGFSQTASESGPAPKEAAIVAQRPQPVPVAQPPAPAPVVVVAKSKAGVVSGSSRAASEADLAPKEAPIVARPQPVPVVVRPPAPAPIVTSAKRQEWLELIDSLRHDVERLRAGRDQPPPVVSAKPKESRAPSLASAAKKPTRKSKKAKPVQDEWGFFDPQQCGFAALLAKLEEITDEEPEGGPRD